MLAKCNGVAYVCRCHFQKWHVLQGVVEAIQTFHYGFEEESNNKLEWR